MVRFVNPNCYVSSFNRYPEDFPDSRRKPTVRNVQRGARVAACRLASPADASRKEDRNIDDKEDRPVRFYAPRTSIEFISRP
jgi:hypothetical protein